MRSMVEGNVRERITRRLRKKRPAAAAQHEPARACAVAMSPNAPQWLQVSSTAGIKTIRFLASDVLNNLDGVVSQIVSDCASRCPSTARRAVPLPGQCRGGV